MESDLGNRFSKRRRIALIVTLGLLTGLGPFTIDLYLPAFPVIKEQWALSDAQITELAGYMRQRYAPGRPAWRDVPEALARVRAGPAHP